MKQYIAILGNTPELSALELGQPWSGGQVLLLPNQPNLARLGGTIKVAEQWLTVPHNLADIEQVYQALEHLAQASTDKKSRIVFGFSVYAGDTSVTHYTVQEYAKKLQRLGITWKQRLRQQGVAARYVASREPDLSSVIVTREHLLENQTDFVIVLRANDCIIGRTVAVQDYHGFSQRDYGRPERDRFAGMLPPKVARMLINIAQPRPTDVILDPFCGSGTIVQEALWLGFRQVIGSDIAAASITATNANIAWAKLPSPRLLCSDVLKLPQHLPLHSVDIIVSEGQLGPQQAHPNKTVIQPLEKFYQAVFPVLVKLIRPSGRIILALPAWKQSNGLTIMELSKTISKAGLKPFHQPIFYGRQTATVLRQIFFLKYQL